MSHQTLDDLYSQLGQRVAVSTLRCPLEEPLNIHLPSSSSRFCTPSLAPRFLLFVIRSVFAYTKPAESCAMRRNKSGPEDDGEE